MIKNLIFGGEKLLSNEGYIFSAFCGYEFQDTAININFNILNVCIFLHNFAAISSLEINAKFLIVRCHIQSSEAYILLFFFFAYTTFNLCI